MRLKVPTTPHTIRFPGYLYEKLQILKDKTGRTFNGLVIWLLEIGYAVAIKHEEQLQKVLEQAEDEEAQQ